MVLRQFSAGRMVVITAKERFMKGKFTPLLDTVSSDGSIINAFIIDNNKKFYEHPNKASDVTDCPERAYYSKEMLALRPLSEIDEGYRACIDHKR